MFCVFVSLSSTFPSLPVVYFVNDFLFLSRLLLPLLWNHPVATTEKKKCRGLTKRRKKKKKWTAPLNIDVDVPIVASNKSWQQWHLQQWRLSMLWRTVQRFQSREQWMFFIFLLNMSREQLFSSTSPRQMLRSQITAHRQPRIQGVRACQGLLRSFKVSFSLRKNVFLLKKTSGHVTGGRPGTLFGISWIRPANFW